jgi:hypothetical protein
MNPGPIERLAYIDISKPGNQALIEKKRLNLLPTLLEL